VDSVRIAVNLALKKFRLDEVRPESENDKVFFKQCCGSES
jgi:hypothetical protein